MGLGTSTTKQTERGTDFTDYPIVTWSLLIFSKVFHFQYFWPHWGILIIFILSCFNTLRIVWYTSGLVHIFKKVASLPSTTVRVCTNVESIALSKFVLVWTEWSIEPVMIKVIRMFLMNLHIQGIELGWLSLEGSKYGLFVIFAEFSKELKVFYSDWHININNLIVAA